MALPVKGTKLSMASVTDDQCHRVAQEMRLNTLTEVCLMGGSVGARGCEALCTALQENKTVTSFTMAGLEDADAERGWFSGIQGMFGRRSSAADGIGVRGCQALCTALQFNKTLRNITLIGDGIRDQGCEALCKALQANETLSSFTILGGGISDQGCEALCAALQDNKTLSSFTISGDGIGDDGCFALCKALQANTALSSVTILGGKISDQGCEALSQVLESNKTLTSFTIIGDVIGVQGCEALCSALQANKTLTSFTIAGSGLGAQGCEALCNALSSSRTLRNFTIVGEGLGAQGCEALCKALQVNKTLTSFSIAVDPRSISNDALCEAMNEAFSANTTLRNLVISRDVTRMLFTVLLGEYLVSVWMPRGRRDADSELQSNRCFKAIQDKLRRRNGGFAPNAAAAAADLDDFCAGLSDSASVDVISTLKSNDIRTVKALVSILQKRHDDFEDLREVLPGNKFSTARQELEDRVNLEVHLMKWFGEESHLVKSKLQEKRIVGLSDLRCILDGSHPEFGSMFEILPGKQNLKYRNLLEQSFKDEEVGLPRELSRKISRGISS